MSSMDFKSPIRDDNRVENMIRRAMAKAAFAAIAQVKISPAMRQALWVVDPLNLSGVASDSNPGTLALPVRTYQGGVAQRWGTFAPRLQQDTTLRFISSHPDNTDPVFFNPSIENGANVTVRGADLGTAGAPLITSGLLAAVAAKNRATPQILRATLNGASGVGNLLVNTTRGNARSWVQKNTAGTTFQLTQPFVPSTLPMPFPPPAEVDTFANGDAFNLFQPTRINLQQCLPTMFNAAASFINTLQVYNCVVRDTSGFSFGGTIDTNQLVTFNEAQVERGILLRAIAGPVSTGGCFNCIGPVSSGVPGLAIEGWSIGVLSGPAIQAYNIFGGCLGFTALAGEAVVDGDVIISANPCYIGGGQLGLVCIDSGAQLILGRDTDWRTTGLYGSNIGWGAGTLDVQGRTACALTATAATQFPSAGFTMRANSGTVADSHTSAAPDVFNAGITISPANIDAAAGAAGFGGEAFVVSGASYRKGIL